MANGNGKEAKIARSRKWFLVLSVFIITTLGVFLPPIISAWLFKAATPLVILTGAEYVSVVTLVVSAYFAGNIWQKKVESDAAVAGLQTSPPVISQPNAQVVVAPKVVSGVRTEILEAESGEA